MHRPLVHAACELTHARPRRRQVPPSVAAGIQQLLLSNNSLRTLGDIADFRLLRSVSLGNNLLRYVEEARSRTAWAQARRVRWPKEARPRMARG